LSNLSWLNGVPKQIFSLIVELKMNGSYST
jgi:hypothetical protein